MLVKLKSVAHIGLSSVLVDVEVDVATQGFPGFTIVGLAGKAVEEARERVKTAIINSGMDFPNKKITVNLAPADLPKDGGAYDLPIAVGILVASGQIVFQNMSTANAVYYGELGLNGDVRPTKGVLLVGLFAQKNKIHEIYVSRASASEASVVEGITVYPVDQLKDIACHIMGSASLKSVHFHKKTIRDDDVVEFDMAEVAGQEQAKRAMLIAAAGGHNILMSGPPGAGKTMLARSMPGLLPQLVSDEALEVTRIYSVAGLLPSGASLVRKRPFRSPHHGISPAGIIGGGSNPLPGEVSLAHLGVLFLDEMAEFPRSVLESLRQPMEDGIVSIVRVGAHVSYPASFTLMAAVNPCPCGYLGHPKRPCTCSEKQVRKYRSRISGPILDRIDLHVLVPAVETEKLHDKNGSGATSKAMRAQVISARSIQTKRFAAEGIYTNSQMRNKHVKKYCELDGETHRILRVAVETYDLSARAYFRLIKVARTIADLAGSSGIDVVHMAEALQYRPTIAGS